jgi:hypothetical protein
LWSVKQLIQRRRFCAVGQQCSDHTLDVEVGGGLVCRECGHVFNRRFRQQRPHLQIPVRRGREQLKARQHHQPMHVPLVPRQGAHLHARDRLPHLPKRDTNRNSQDRPEQAVIGSGRKQSQGGAEVARSRALIVLSRAPEISVRPDSDHARDTTSPRCPSRLLMSVHEIPESSRRRSRASPARVAQSQTLITCPGIPILNFVARTGVT